MTCDVREHAVQAETVVAQLGWPAEEQKAAPHLTQQATVTTHTSSSTAAQL